MKLHLALTLFTSLTAAAASSAEEEPTVSYDGYKVFRVETHGRASSVEAQLADITYEQWNDESETHLDILVGPGDVPVFEALGLDFSVMHEDLGASIAAESGGAGAQQPQRRQDDAWFDSYHNYEDHIDFFRDLQASFPDQSETISAGRSVQGRDIFGIHLWGADGPGKPAILYHATVHAREWIAAPVVEYITSQLISGYKAGDNDTVSVLDQYDFYIFPFVNPDGFVYTQTTNRLWRKNRQTRTGNTCVGTDINRNWEFAWDANSGGASPNPCSETYRGEDPSDTPENAGLDAYLRDLRDSSGVKLFIDWHSYGQYILSPFGYSDTVYAPELGTWTRSSSLVSEAIQDFSDRNTTYTFGPSGATLYPTTGAAPDHAYVIGGADFSYTIELPDTGSYGFVLPPSRIRGVVEESWVGQQVLYSLLETVSSAPKAQLFEAEN